jgi:hypothetical protein
MGARNRVGIGLSYRPARLYRLVDLIPWKVEMVHSYFQTFMEPRNRFQGMNSASLCSPAGRYDKPIPPRFLALIDSLKIPAVSLKVLKFGLRKGDLSAFVLRTVTCTLFVQQVQSQVLFVHKETLNHLSSFF